MGGTPHYILLNIDLTNSRDDYWTLKSIDKAYKEFIDALEKARQKLFLSIWGHLDA